MESIGAVDVIEFWSMWSQRRSVETSYITSHVSKSSATSSVFLRIDAGIWEGFYFRRFLPLGLIFVKTEQFWMGGADTPTKKVWHNSESFATQRGVSIRSCQSMNWTTMFLFSSCFLRFIFSLFTNKIETKPDKVKKHCKAQYRPWPWKSKGLLPSARLDPPEPGG